MKTSIIKSLIVLSIITIGFVSCERKSEDKGKAGQRQEQKAGLKPGEVMISQKQFENVGIQLGNLEQRNLRDVVKANGFLTLAPQHKASISAYIGGVVKSIFVQEGDYVKKGETLALLEHPDYIQLQEDYLKSKSNLTVVEKEYYREKELFKKNLSSEQVYQQVESEYTNAKAAFTSIEKKVELLNINLVKLDKDEIVSSIQIISPINGYVQTVGVNLGKFADPMKEIFSIVDNSKIQLDLQIYEKDIFKVKTGQKIYFTLPNQKDVAGNASIFALNKAFDDNTKSITVHAKVTGNTEKNFLPGIYVNGFIETGTKKTDALPSEAIINEGQKNKVFVLLRTVKDAEGEEFIFGMRDVKVGITEAGFTEVTFLSRLVGTKDAKIVVRGTFFIESEMNKGQEGELD